MGIDLIPPCLAAPIGREPDWSLAAAWIATAPPSVLVETGDDLFPHEMWFEEARAAGAVDPASPKAAAPYARRLLAESASLVRAALEDPVRANLLTLDLPTHRVACAFGLDGGADLELSDAFIYFAESGAAQAAGFTHWIEFAAHPLEERASTAELERLMCQLDEKCEAILSGEIVPAMVGPDSLAWVATQRTDWQAAEQALKELGLRGDELRRVESDLDTLRGYIERDEYSRMVSSIEIDETTVWFFADCNDFGERAVFAVQSLGSCRVLDAAGVLGWSAP